MSKKRKIQCAIVIIGVIIIPLLYSYFYLGAFWDPYSRLEKLPVAVVNNDNGAKINNKDRNLGEELCEKLKDDGTLKFEFTDESTAKKGTKEDDYYAMIVIPEGFSKDIASSATTEKKAATITFSSNQKRNYLASQILNSAVTKIEESVRSSVNKEVTQQLADKLNEIPDQLTEVQDGAKQLNDGSIQLKDGSLKLADGLGDLASGSQKLADGTSEYSSKLKEYSTGVSGAKAGADKLNAGMSDLDQGINELLAGANKAVLSTAELNTLKTGAASLAASASAYSTNMSSYVTGVNALLNTITNPDLAVQVATVKGTGKALKTAAAQISGGAALIANGTKSMPELRQGLLDIQAGLKKADAGSNQLLAGSKDLAAGMSKLNTATGQLQAASGTIASGASNLAEGSKTAQQGATDLSDGATKLADGTGTLYSSVSDALVKSGTELKKLDGISDFSGAPVNVKQDNVTDVPNYGTAFAPYFMSLSLWVGGLIIFMAIYYDPSGKFNLLSINSEKRVLRSFGYLSIGFVQALILGFILKFALGLKVANSPLYYLSCCLVSLVFIAIIQFLMVFLKDAGKFLSMLLLILQLTSCGGTFPLETIPKFFGVLYPFMPMTYSVGLFKQTISGIDNGELMYNMGILFAILLIVMAATVFLSTVRAKVQTAEDRELVAEVK